MERSGSKINLANLVAGKKKKVMQFIKFPYRQGERDKALLSERFEKGKKKK